MSMSVPSRGASTKRPSSVLRNSSEPERMSAGVTRAAPARRALALAKNAASADRMNNSAAHQWGGERVVDVCDLTAVTFTDVGILVSQEACPEPAYFVTPSRRTV